MLLLFAEAGTTTSYLLILPGDFAFIFPHLHGEPVPLVRVATDQIFQMARGIVRILGDILG